MQECRLLRYFRAADHQTLPTTTEVHAGMPVTSVFLCCRPSTLTLTLPKYKQNWRLLRYFPAPILTISLLHYRSTCRNVGYFGIFVLPFYQTLSATTEVHARMPVTSVTASAHLSNLIKNTEVIAYLPFTSVFPISRHSSSWPTSPSKGAVFSHPHNSSAASHLSLNRGTKIIFDRETFAVRPRN